MSFRAVSIVTFFLLLMTSGGVKSEETQEVMELDEVVVTATKVETSIKDIPSSVSVITQEDIKRKQAIRSEELLKGLEGVDNVSVMAGGYPGKPRLRGLPSTFAGQTTQYLINGLPVEPALIGNRQAWMLVPPQAIERIEVVRGPISVLYGPSAAGGVINIITKQGLGTPSAELSGGYGSHASYRSTVSSGGTLEEKLDYMIVGDYYKTDGYKPLPNAASTPFPDRDYYSEGNYDIKNRDSEDRKLYSSLRFHPTDSVELSAGLSYFDNEGAILGGHPNYRWERYGHAVDVGYRQRFSELLELKAKVLQSSFKNRTTNDENFSEGNGSMALDYREIETETALNGELQGDLNLSKINTLTLGLSHNLGELEFSEEDADAVQLRKGSAKSTVSALYAQDQHKFGDLVVTTLGMRYDQYKFYDDERGDTSYPDSDDDVLTYRAGARVNPSKETSVYVSVGTAYLPALNSLKFRTSDSWLDNPDLKPEKSISYEVGLDQWIGSAVKTKLAAFYTQYEEMISSVQTGTQWQYRNVSEVEVKGVEAGVETVLAEDWLMSINYTLTDPEITKNPSDPDLEGKRPADTPEHKLNAAITYDNPRLILARIEGRYVGDRYYDNANTSEYKTGDYFVMDAKVSKTFSTGKTLKDVTLSLAVNNIFDEHYSEYWFENADGVNVWAEAVLKF